MFKLQDRKRCNKLLAFKNFWTKSIASLEPNTWHITKTPCSSQNSKLKPVKTSKAINVYGYKRDTPHKPSQPRMMKYSISITSKLCISGVATTPIANRIIPQDYKHFQTHKCSFSSLVDAIMILYFWLLTKIMSSLEWGKPFWIGDLQRP